MKKKSTTCSETGRHPNGHTQKGAPHVSAVSISALAISALNGAWRGMAFFAATAFFFGAILFGCSTPGHYLPDGAFSFQDPQSRPEINALISEIRKKNAGLKTFKGIGKIRFQRTGASQVARAAWMADVPGKFYISILAPVGPPLARFAGDGSSLYIAVQNGSKIYKRRYRSGIQTAAIKRFIPIPVNFNDLVLFLAGQIPLPKRLRADFCKNKKESGRCLIIEDTESRDIQRLYFDEDKKTVKKIESYSKNGALKYWARFGKIKETGGFLVPMSLFFSDDMGTDFSLRISRYWPNAPVLSESFVLTQ